MLLNSTLGKKLYKIKHYFIKVYKYDFNKKQL